MSETCRVSCQKKCEKLVHLICFIIKKFVTMHGHINVKNMLETARPFRNPAQIRAVLKKLEVKRSAALWDFTQS